MNEWSLRGQGLRECVHVWDVCLYLKGKNPTRQTPTQWVTSTHNTHLCLHSLAVSNHFCLDSFWVDIYTNVRSGFKAKILTFASMFPRLLLSWQTSESGEREKPKWDIACVRADRRMLFYPRLDFLPKSPIWPLTSSMNSHTSVLFWCAS